MPTPVTVDSNHPTIVMTDSYLAEVAGSVALGEESYPAIDSRLWAQLGCPYWDDFDIKYPNLSPLDRSAAQAAIPRLLGLIDIVGARRTTPNDIFNLLTALDEAGGWGVCLETTSASYFLAASICLTIPRLLNPDEQAISVIIAVVNKWVAPANEWQVLPDAEEVARCLFGPAWCDLALAGMDSDDKPGVAAAILRERPPFLPGLCPAQNDILSVPLPSEIGFSI